MSNDFIFIDQFQHINHEIIGLIKKVSFNSIIPTHSEIDENKGNLLHENESKEALNYFSEINNSITSMSQQIIDYKKIKLKKISLAIDNLTGFTLMESNQKGKENLLIIEKVNEVSISRINSKINKQTFCVDKQGFTLPVKDLNFFESFDIEENKLASVIPQQNLQNSQNKLLTYCFSNNNLLGENYMTRDLNEMKGSFLGLKQNTEFKFIKELKEITWIDKKTSISFTELTKERVISFIIDSDKQKSSGCFEALRNSLKLVINNLTQKEVKKKRSNKTRNIFDYTKQDLILFELSVSLLYI